MSPKAGDYARAQASVRRAACGACRAAGGDVRRAVPARLVALRAAAEWRKIQEQADGVRTASEYDESRRPAWSARANVDGLRDAAAFRGVAVASQLSMAQEAAEALTTLHGEQLCSRVHILRSSAPPSGWSDTRRRSRRPLALFRLFRPALAKSCPAAARSRHPALSRGPAASLCPRPSER